ncbi:hypothetical protein CAMSH0001_0172 [Campylobacter showae RM3277]|uniref:Uncharacterized protein n=1 Tax=Campylobacter showae RM3277 TaxID=553219 RepID=C6RJ70_9BACT|nr:hypothetical protein CAMSH0001_0172 [Campylobacter showae RM3277]
MRPERKILIFFSLPSFKFAKLYTFLGFKFYNFQKFKGGK